MLNNPHIESNEVLQSQILREGFVRVGEYFPVKLFLISEPIWIPSRIPIQSPPEKTPKKSKKSEEQEELEQLTIDQRFRKLYNSSQASSIRHTVAK